MRKCDVIGGITFPPARDRPAHGPGPQFPVPTVTDVIIIAYCLVKAVSANNLLVSARVEPNEEI